MALDGDTDRSVGATRQLLTMAKAAESQARPDHHCARSVGRQTARTTRDALTCFSLATRISVLRMRDALRAGSDSVDAIDKPGDCECLEELSSVALARS